MDGSIAPAQAPIWQTLTSASGGGLLIAISLVVVGGLLVLVSLPSGRRLIWRLVHRRERPAPPSIEQRLADGAKQINERQQLEQLMHDVHEVTRLCAARIDDRASRLESLLSRAEAMIARLDELSHQGDRTDQGTSVSVRSIRPHSEPRSPHPVDHSRSGGAEHDMLAKRVCELARTGKTPVQIAGELEEQVGKVELILALNS